jgi:hypothetical protein
MDGDGTPGVCVVVGTTEDVEGRIGASCELFSMGQTIVQATHRFAEYHWKVETRQVNVQEQVLRFLRFRLDQVENYDQLSLSLKNLALTT